MTATTARVEVTLKASKTCYLSDGPPFCLVVHIKLCNSQGHVTFLQDGYAGVEGYQPINSDRVIQCFDDETGEQIHIISQGSEPRFLDKSYVQFSTNKELNSDVLPIVTSSLRPNRKYRIRFRPMSPISHWPASPVDGPEALESLKSVDPSPPNSTIPWSVADRNDTIIFDTKSSAPSTPNITVSLSAPSIYSLSERFAFTLTFSTDVGYPITVLADRSEVKSLDSDIAILDGKSGDLLAPEDIDYCKDEDGYERDQFLQINGSYTERRELDFDDPAWEDLELKIGEEYILRHSGSSWWWTEDSIDETLEYLKSERSLGLAVTKAIDFVGAGEFRFKVVK